MALKEYVCYWGYSFTVQECRLEDQTFFRVEVGYEPEEIQTILELDINETWDSVSYPDHWVRRVI